MLSVKFNDDLSMVPDKRTYLKAFCDFMAMPESERFNPSVVATINWQGMQFRAFFRGAVLHFWYGGLARGEDGVKFHPCRTIRSRYVEVERPEQGLVALYNLELVEFTADGEPRVIFEDREIEHVTMISNVIHRLRVDYDVDHSWPIPVEHYGVGGVLVGRG